MVNIDLIDSCIGGRGGRRQAKLEDLDEDAPSLALFVDTSAWLLLLVFMLLLKVAAFEVSGTSLVLGCTSVLARPAFSSTMPLRCRFSSAKLTNVDPFFDSLGLSRLLLLAITAYVVEAISPLVTLVVESLLLAMGWLAPFPTAPILLSATTGQLTISSGTLPPRLFLRELPPRQPLGL